MDPAISGAGTLDGAVINQDETVALFLQGREPWNAWAEKMLAGRRALEEAGRWAAEKDFIGGLEAKNDETRAWMENAQADFSYCLFLVRQTEGTKETVGEEKKEAQDSGPPVTSIQLKSVDVDFSGFVFPGDALFLGVTFSGNARFQNATFTGGARGHLATRLRAPPLPATPHSRAPEAATRSSRYFTGAWFENATFSGDTRFQNATFTGGAQFERATFTGNACFNNATFSGGARFGSATFIDAATFERATFGATSDLHHGAGLARFERATFTGPATFEGATFTGGARFESATFTGRATFESATFTGGAWFESATFIGPANFDRATFTSTAGFRRASFSGEASFQSADLSVGGFESTAFQRSTSFIAAKFRGEARFLGVKVERAFYMTGAVFADVPAFNWADFKQAPDLDGVRFPLPSFWRRGKTRMIAQYRAIRRMAIQGADYEREQMASKGELRARRWTTDKFWHPGLWLGIFYDGVADCGRSIVRPAFVWLASILVFAAFYWLRATADIETRCAEASGPLVQALYLSVKNALVLFGGTRDARANQAYLCLYDGTPQQPHIPATVTFAETLLQIPVSAALIFLLLLAVKNRFKIK